MKKEKRLEKEEEETIIALLFERKEAALDMIRTNYEQYCRRIAPDIECEDFEECFDDTLLHVWNSIPPDRPAYLQQYVAVIFRHLVINMVKASNSLKRGGGKLDIPIEEAEEFFDIRDFADAPLMEEMLLELIGQYLSRISKRKRVMFLRRYWYLNSVEYIADLFSVSPGTVRSTLCRTREGLRKYLRENDVIV